VQRFLLDYCLNDQSQLLWTRGDKLPVHVQGEEKQSVVKKKIKSWAKRVVTI
jgi:hypothetical protein